MMSLKTQAMRPSFFAGIFQKVPGDVTNLRDRFSLGEVADRIRTVEGGQNGIAH